MAEGFDVNVGEVRQHSSTVATISNQVNTACNMAQASVHGGAYGMVGQFFAAAIMLASDEVRDGILKGAKAFMDVHNGLREIADLYQQVDEARAELFRLTGEGERR